MARGDVSVTKYLGVINDLSFSFHAYNKYELAQPKRLIIMVKSLLSSTFSPSSQLMHWMYTVLIRPTFTYLFYVWGQVLKANFQTQLIRVQSFGLHIVVNFRGGTPNEGLSLIHI